MMDSNPVLEALMMRSMMPQQQPSAGPWTAGANAIGQMFGAAMLGKRMRQKQPGMIGPNNYTGPYSPSADNAPDNSYTGPMY